MKNSEKWNNYIKEEGRDFGYFALRMENIVEDDFKKKLISKDDYIEMSIGLTEKQFMKDYGEAQYYADGSFRYTYPKFVKRSEFVFDSSKFEIHASYITTDADDDDENEETETGLYTSMEFYNNLSTSMFQELQETQWKNLPPKWKKLISRDMDHPIYAEDDGERW